MSARILSVVVALVVSSPLSAQLNDVTQTPNTENVGIKKSFEEEIGAGRGDLSTVDSSLYLIGRDPFRSIMRGRQLFQRKFTVAQGFGPRTGDGVGDIEADGSLGAGLVDSCAGCHSRPRGSAGFGGNVFTRPDSRDAPHLFGLGLQEMLADEITQELRAIRDEAVASAAASGESVTRELRAKSTDERDRNKHRSRHRRHRGKRHGAGKDGISYGTITALPDGTVDTSGVAGVDEDLRVRPFFAEGSTISIREFVVGALNAEMGLEAADPDLAAASGGERIVTPSGMVLDGTTDKIEAPPVASETDDADGDGVVDEIPTSIVDHLEFYLLNYFKPAIHRQSSDALRGQLLFHEWGCATCHIPNLEIARDRRVADVETNFDPENGVFNDLFAVAAPLFEETDDGSGLPTTKTAQGGSFLVRNIFTDFKRHDLGPQLWERNFDGTIRKEFLTEPLWGVGSTPPYGHDGRSINLRDIIQRHGGEAAESRRQFLRAPEHRQEWLIDFLESLVLFGPPDTASNLGPADPTAEDFPQRGHGSIDLSVLFNDPADKE